MRHESGFSRKQTGIGFNYSFGQLLLKLVEVKEVYATQQKLILLRNLRLKFVVETGSNLTLAQARAGAGRKPLQSQSRIRNRPGSYFV